MTWAYEVGVDECMPTTVGRNLAAAKVNTWLRVMRRTKERRRHGLRTGQRVDVKSQ